MRLAPAFLPSVATVDHKGTARPRPSRTIQDVTDADVTKKKRPEGHGRMRGDICSECPWENTMGEHEEQQRSVKKQLNERVNVTRE